DDALLVAGVEVVDLLEQVVVDERPLLQAAGHPLPPFPAAAPAADDELLRRLVLVAGAALGLTPRRHRVAAARRLALAASERVVDRVHGHAPGLGTDALPPVAAGLADRHQVGLGVAHLADGRPAVDGH